MWSGGLCSHDSDCHPKIRTRVPSSAEEIGTSLCGCYATSVIDPLDECQGEFESGCAIAACFVNSCFDMEAFCSVEKGICELRSPEIFTIHDTFTWDEETEVTSRDEDDGTFVLKHDGHEVVFTLDNGETTPTVDVPPEEQNNDTVVVINAEDETKVIFIDAPEEEISENNALSMSMVLVQHNLAFEWDDSETKLDSQKEHEQETTVPDDGHTDFSWVTLEEDDDRNDDDVALEISMSMPEEISVDYTWIESDESDDDVVESDDASVLIATIPTEETTSSTLAPDDNDTDFTWVDLKEPV